MVKNKDIFDKMVKAQQSQYYWENKIIERIEEYFKKKGLEAYATLKDYNYIRINISNTLNKEEIGCREQYMCDFDINDFLEEFGLEVSWYEHGWSVIKSCWKKDINYKMFWRFEVQRV